MSSEQNSTDSAPHKRRMEIYAFLLVTALVIPALAVATVGTLGSHRVDIPGHQWPARPSCEVRCAVVDKPFTRSVDRRKFINGRWTTIEGSERP